jgi:nucleoid-associated protein YgaU
MTPSVTTSPALVARPVAAVAALDFTDRAAPQAPTPRSVEPSDPLGEEDSRAGLVNPTVTVRRHDTLWSLSETHLGSGERFREIVELNRGRPQPDGRTLKDAGWIYPGWILRLPADARTRHETRPSDRTAVSRSDEMYVVERGDSLWEIADDQFGAGERYGEIYELNDGRPTAGRHASDRP